MTSSCRQTSNTNPALIGNKQRVLTPGHQGWNDLHSLCGIGMEYYLLNDNNNNNNNDNNNNNKNDNNNNNDDNDNNDNTNVTAT